MFSSLPRLAGRLVVALSVLAFWSVATGAAVAAPAAQAATTTVILVRHAEKVLDGSDDPPLTEAGRERAEGLRAVLADAKVGAVYATPTRRTRQTAEPLAKACGLAAQEVELTGDYAGRQAALLRQRPPGDVAVVVSHSNKVPEVLAALGVPAPPAIADDSYDNLFVVTLPATGAPTLLHLRYGRPSGG